MGAHANERGVVTVAGETDTKAQAVIQAIVNADVIAQQHMPGTAGPPPVITLSRDFGAGGNTIASLLAARLGVEVYDREILDEISKESKVDSELMAQLDEKVRADKTSAWIRSIFTNNTAFPTSYRHHLVNVVLGICNTGGIIMGRGGHIILAARHAFRVRIVGSEERCAERIAERDGISIEEARAKIGSVNRERDDFLWKMFHRRVSDASLFDMIINTDQFQSLESVADILWLAMQQSERGVHQSDNN